MKEKVVVTVPAATLEATQRLTAETNMLGVPVNSLYAFANGETMIVSEDFNSGIGPCSPNNAKTGVLMGVDPDTGEFLFRASDGKDFRAEPGNAILPSTLKKIANIERGNAIFDAISILREMKLSNRLSCYGVIALGFICLLFKQPLWAIMVFICSSFYNSRFKAMENMQEVMVDKLKFYLCYRAVGEKFNLFADEAADRQNEIIAKLINDAHSHSSFTEYVWRLDIK